MSYQSLLSAAQVRELDRIVIEECGISGYELMQRAGRFSYETLKETWPECKAIIVICGRGNNAGDGYVLAKLAIEDGKCVRIVNCFDPKMLKGDAERAFEDLLTLDPSFFDMSSSLQALIHENIDYISDASISYPVLVDAIFGTGLTRDIDGKLFTVIETLNEMKEADRKIKILSIDIPSGLNADTGNIMNVAVNADVTATFMGRKRGMFTHDGCEYSGQIEFNDLDIPEAIRIAKNLPGPLRANPVKTVLRNTHRDDHCYLTNYFDFVAELLCKRFVYHNPPVRRERNAHKGHFGHVLVIGGDEGYLGAVQMAAEAAMRVGAGLVSVATRKSHAAQLSIAVPEIMSHGVETLDELMPLIKRATVIAIGPGLGQSEWAKLLFARVLESDLPIIIDADGLNLLAEEEQSSQNWVITPHPGEAARLLKTDVATIQSDRFQSARDLHEKYQGPVVLKGAGSIVIDLEGNLYVCSEGNPGMSTGGMGDVLTGVIAGLVAQGRVVTEARGTDGTDIGMTAQMGVVMHARAGDMAASYGERGMMATDLMPYLRELANPNLE